MLGLILVRRFDESRLKETASNVFSETAVTQDHSMRQLSEVIVVISVKLCDRLTLKLDYGYGIVGKLYRCSQWLRHPWFQNLSGS